MYKRDFLKLSTIIGAALVINPLSACKSLEKTAKTASKSIFSDPFLTEKGSFTLPPLGYEFKALEPNIDAMTMEIHHDKHHAAYVKKLNEAIKGSSFETQTLAEIFQHLTTAKEHAVIRNNGGGHFNHSLFWHILSPSATPTKPSGKLLEAINRDFISVDKMLEQLQDAAAKQFGSGWAWLSVNADNKLFISTTPNQDNPLMKGIIEKEKQGTPILGIDVWEHVYYLKYQNERKKYLAAIPNVLNWGKIGERYERITSGS